MSTEIIEMLEKISAAQQTLIARQEETLEFIRGEAEKSKQIRDEAMAMQKQAASRIRRIGYLAFPAILACVFLLVYLLVKYPIL